MQIDLALLLNHRQAQAVNGMTGIVPAVGTFLIHLVRITKT